MKHFKVTRDVTPQECIWLDKAVEKDTVVAEFRGCTYGCCSGQGKAVTNDLERGDGPFYELPNDALEVVFPFEVIVKEVYNVSYKVYSSSHEEAKATVEKEIEVGDIEPTGHDYAYTLEPELWSVEGL